MKEYTIIHNVELTYIERADYTPTDASEPKETERMLKEATASDEYACRGNYCPNCGAKMDGVIYNE